MIFVGIFYSANFSTKLSLNDIELKKSLCFTDKQISSNGKCDWQNMLELLKMLFFPS